VACLVATSGAGETIVLLLLDELMTFSVFVFVSLVLSDVREPVMLLLLLSTDEDEDKKCDENDENESGDV
jgi:hypothetical protein